MTMPTKIIAPILLEDFRKVVTKRDKGKKAFFILMIWSGITVDSIYSHCGIADVCCVDHLCILFGPVYV